MGTAAMRRIDAWVGVPLCALLTLARRIIDLFRRTPKGPVERILFVKLAEQGSTVLAYAALRRAVEAVGPKNVYFLAFEENRFILDAMEVIPPENVVTIRATGMFRTAFSTLGAVRRLRKLRLDAAVDLEFFARSTAILSWLSGARRRVGLHAYAGDGPWRGDLMTHRLAYNPHLHTSRLFELQVRALEHPPVRLPAIEERLPDASELPRGRFEPRAGEAEQVAAILGEITGEASPVRLVLLNANCGDLLPLRRWDDENYAALAHRLLDDDPTLWIAFTGAPGEAPAVEELVRRIDRRRCVSMAGRTTMRQLLVLYGLAEVLVTNDSGPAHFASLTPIDVVTLFGPETPHLFGVRSDRSHVLWAKTPCSPCVSAYNNRVSRCRDNVCMRMIGVDEVFETVREALAQRAP
jgi:ADP-heptose:LPS heptosyltransferase